METLELIEESFKVINSSPVESLNELLKIICTNLRGEYGAIWTFDGSKNTLALDVLHGYPSEEELEHRSARIKVPVEKGWVAMKALTEAQRNGTAWPVVERVSETTRFPVIPSDTKEVLAYAVDSMGEQIAVLTLGSTREAAFRRFVEDSSEHHQLELGGRLISLAIASRQSVVFRLDEFIKRGEFDDINVMSKAIIRWVLNTFQVNSCALLFVDYDEETGQDYLYCAERITKGEPESNVRDIRYAFGEGYSGWVAANRACLILTDWEQHSSKVHDSYEQRYGARPLRTGRFSEKHPHVTYKSYMGIPITDGGRVIGVLEVLDTEREYAFSDEGLLEMIGNRIAYEYNRISQKRRQENLYALPNVGRRDLNQVIDVIVSAAMEVCAATHGFFLYKEPDGVFTPKGIKGRGLTAADIPPVRPEQQSLVNYVLQSRNPFFIQNMEEERDRLPAEKLAFLKNTVGAGGFIQERFKSLLMVPVHEPGGDIPPADGPGGADGYADLGVLVLMSLRPSPFKQDELIIAALAEIVGYHILINKKLVELDHDRQQVSELREAMQNYQQAIIAAAASAGTVHSAKKHIADIAGAIERLVGHQRIRQNPELFDLAKQIAKPFGELSLLYDRLHLIYGGDEPNFKTCDILELVQEVRSYMEPTFRERNIEFRNLVNSGEFPKVKADDILMKVVFINLVRNSIEANARKITVTAKKTTLGVPGVEPREAVEVCFKDDGIGIPQENWRDIFKLFFTAHKKGGSGVGLAVNRHIMDKHKGRIRVVTSAVGEGTTIAVTWPVSLP